MEVHSDGESNPRKEAIPGTVGVALTEGKESSQRWEPRTGSHEQGAPAEGLGDGKMETRPGRMAR